MGKPKFEELIRIKELKDEEKKIFDSFRRNSSIKIKKEILVSYIKNLTKQEALGEIL